MFVFQQPGQFRSAEAQKIIEASKKKKKRFANRAEREALELRPGIKSLIPFSVGTANATEPRQKLHSSSS